MVTDHTTGKRRALTDAERAARYRSNQATKVRLMENLSNECQRLHAHIQREANKNNVTAKSLLGTTPAETLRKVRLSLFKNAGYDQRDVTKSGKKAKTL